MLGGFSGHGYRVEAEALGNKSITTVNERAQERNWRQEGATGGPAVRGTKGGGVPPPGELIGGPGEG